MFPRYKIALALGPVVALAVATATWINRGPALHADLVPIHELRRKGPAAVARAAAQLEVAPAVLQAVIDRGPYRHGGEIPRLSELFPDRIIARGKQAGWLNDPQNPASPIDWATVPATPLQRSAPDELAALLVSLRMTQHLEHAADVPVVPVNRLAFWTPGQVARMFWGALLLVIGTTAGLSLWFGRQSPGADRSLLLVAGTMMALGVSLQFGAAEHPLRAFSVGPRPLFWPNYFASAVFFAGGGVLFMLLQDWWQTLMEPENGVWEIGFLLPGLLIAPWAISFLSRHLGAAGHVAAFTLLVLIWIAGCRPLFRPGGQRLVALAGGVAYLSYVSRGGAAGKALAVELTALLFFLVLGARIAEQNAPAILAAYPDRSGRVTVRHVLDRTQRAIARTWRQWLLLIWITALAVAALLLQDFGWAGWFLATCIGLGVIAWNCRALVPLGMGATVLLIAILFGTGTGQVRNRIIGWEHPFEVPPGLSPRALGYYAQNAELVWSRSAPQPILGSGWGTLQVPLQNQAEDYPTLVQEPGGLLGFGLLASLLILLTTGGFQVALQQRTCGRTLAAVGLTGWLVMPSLVSLAVAAGACPITGVSCRWLGYGAASTALATLAGCLLVQLSDLRPVRLSPLTPPPGLRRNVAWIGAGLCGIPVLLWLVAAQAALFPGDSSVRALSASAGQVVNPRLKQVMARALPAALVFPDGTPALSIRGGHSVLHAPPEYSTALGLYTSRGPAGWLADRGASLTGIPPGKEGRIAALGVWRDTWTFFRRRLPTGQSYRFPTAHPIVVGRLPFQVTVQQYLNHLFQATGEAQVAGCFLNTTTGEVLASGYAPAWIGSVPPDPLQENELLEQAGYFQSPRHLDLWNVPAQMHRAPGSTWKLVTLVAWAEAGLPPFRVRCRGRRTIVQDPVSGHSVVLPCWSRQGHGRMAATDRGLVRGLEVSCDTLYGALALHLGPERQFQAWQRLGLRVAASPGRKNFLFSEDSAGNRGTDTPSPALVGASGFGQGRVTTSVWEIAALAALPYNGGLRVFPWICPADRRPPVSIRPGTARLLAQGMEAAARHGTAARISSRLLGAKTGTAQGGGLRSDAWLTGTFATASGDRISFCVWAREVVDRRGSAGAFWRRAALAALIEQLALFRGAASEPPVTPPAPVRFRRKDA